MSRGVRKAAFVLPTLITLAVVAVAGYALLQQRQIRSDRIAEAEKVGATYFSDIATFRADLERSLGEVKSGDPADLKEVVDDRLKHPPELGPAPEGAEDSETYRAAMTAQKTAMKPFENLSQRLGRAAQAQEFVDAADEVLDNGPITLLGHGLVFDSEPLRERVLPELNRALEEFRAVEIPEGARDVAVKIESALTYVIDQVQTMADRADEGSSYEFSYDTQYDDARQAVQDYATKVDGDVAESLDRIRGGRPT